MLQFKKLLRDKLQLIERQMVKYRKWCNAVNLCSRSHKNIGTDKYWTGVKREKNGLYLFAAFLTVYTEMSKVVL